MAVKLIKKLIKDNVIIEKIIKRSRWSTIVPWEMETSDWRVSTLIKR